MSNSLSWTEVPIPDGQPLVSIAQLLVESDGAFWALVRFPPGWARPVAGHYQHEERFWILDGELEMNGRRYPAGEGETVPAGGERAQTATPAGALAVVRFGGPPRWERSR